MAAVRYMVCVMVLSMAVSCNRHGKQPSCNETAVVSDSAVVSDEPPYIPEFLIEAGVTRDWSTDTIRISPEGGEIPAPLDCAGIARLHLGSIVMDPTEVSGDYPIGIIGWMPLGHTIVGFQSNDATTYACGYLGLYDPDGRLADVLYIDRWYDSYWENDTVDYDKTTMAGYLWTECVLESDSIFKVIVHIEEQYYPPESERTDSCAVVHYYRIADGKFVYDGHEIDTGTNDSPEIATPYDAVYELQWDIWYRPLSDPGLFDVWDRMIRKYGLGEVAMNNDARRTFMWQLYGSDPERFWTWVYRHRDDEMLSLMLHNIYAHDKEPSAHRLLTDANKIADPDIKAYALHRLQGYGCTPE